MWCSRCHCVYPASDWWRRNWTCPNGCGAGASQARSWDEVLSRWPHLPETPVAGWVVDPHAIPEDEDGVLASR